MLLNPNSPLNGTPISSREDVRNLGEKKVKDYIKEMLDQCAIMICLIGNVSHNSVWIDYEMAVATSKRIPIIGVQIPATTGGAPTLFISRRLPILNWDANDIAEEVYEILN